MTLRCVDDVPQCLVETRNSYFMPHFIRPARRTQRGCELRISVSTAVLHQRHSLDALRCSLTLQPASDGRRWNLGELRLFQKVRFPFCSTRDHDSLASADGAAELAQPFSARKYEHRARIIVI